MTDTSDPIAILLAGYAAAVHAKDVTAFAALYDEEVRCFELWGSWASEGREAWRAMAAGWFGSLGDERVVVTVDGLRTEPVAGDLAAGSAFLRYSAVAPDGRVLRFLDNRITLVARLRDGQWRIVHEHTSAPVEHGSAKAVLQRPGG